MRLQQTAKIADLMIIGHMGFFIADKMVLIMQSVFVKT